MSLPDPISPLSNTKSNYVIIVAGGSGTRMQSVVPKQFLLINGKPVLMHTIEAFHKTEANPSIIIVLHAGFHNYWNQLCIEHHFDIPFKLVNGGETRFHSVKNGLDIIPDNVDTLVAIHDAVRALTSKEIIDKSYKYAAEHGNAITAVKSRDSVRQLKNNISVALVRDEIYLVQTPQTFQSAQIKKAYLQPYNTKFTDDASVVEEMGEKINLIEGNYNNIKITFPEDIAIAELLMKC
ncbi:2-C-methyl-D-erythritol 4-phosphate cytidylyltransferase [Mucilaginibacter frigoritolerans]|jgi:2-C-methyl-D-erythritol 4-phosphate cytidylyltransferase|uniref:2-C-methyl-D-erythritol 4-phosphate cytidylyltransferase n=1 Tax=Mucilaginibacter frigoritolerans TaxID=652788 RepID=A0A562UG12_9SPHI|nr:2-C-methyl-D-erythritol 4-phosphate cytidylyltransferase [Mucilaginibacter frigoritolerans]TWJ04770.1 2-C-methyl-D-erythritol 4-phosphate cytidylyltransferase [Mucilaginibacter frigoritolerans]